MKVIHTAVDVSDLDATKAFYIDALGLEHSWGFEVDGKQNFYVAGPDGEGEIQFVYDPDDDSAIDPSGINHIAVEVDDTDATFEHLLETTDAEAVTEPEVAVHGKARIAFLTDPDGYVVELVEPIE